jgi:hypothetical protein
MSRQGESISNENVILQKIEKIAEKGLCPPQFLVDYETVESKRRTSQDVLSHNLLVLPKQAARKGFFFFLKIVSDRCLTGLVFSI